jgi:hypothetical protein
MKTFPCRGWRHHNADHRTTSSFGWYHHSAGHRVIFSHTKNTSWHGWCLLDADQHTVSIKHYMRFHVLISKLYLEPAQ